MSTPEPGWYPNPDQPGQARYWDGARWTDASKPLDESPAGPTGDSSSRKWMYAAIGLGLAVVALVAFMVFQPDDESDSSSAAKPAASKSTTTSSSSTTRTTATTTTTFPAATATSNVAPAGPGSGDLQIPGHPMTRPVCNGSFITHIYAATNPAQYFSEVSNALTAYPGSEYLLTNQSCSSFNQVSREGNPIYVVYFGAYATLAEACDARSGRPGAYVKVLDNTPAPTTPEPC